ncbi:putative glycosyltransferase EpsE [termite gut metagenome]|uniref:Putative glycosyltransferase EpsE n=1 Tax=termite gut metagenome TaxID=433724 RepID=A0A5J4STW8_9ZZZZ
MEKTTKVSVVMCTYNGKKFVREQLDSILKQTYPIHEIIIQDDCSSDGTWGVLQEYTAQYPFIQVFRNEKQKGINANFFSAIERASGDFIAISDQDDIWEPDKTERQVPYLNDFLLVAGITSSFSGEKNVEVPFDGIARNHHLERLIYTNAIAGHTMMFRKSLIDKIPKYWLKDYGYDHLLALVAVAHESLMYIPHLLVHHRRLSTSATYSKPLNYKKTLGNSIRYTIRTLKLFGKVRSQMISHFQRMYLLLNAIEVDSQSKKNALKLAHYHSGNLWLTYWPLAWLCIRLRDKLFYRPEKNQFLAIFRALYFPISSSDYFRFGLNE